MNSFVGFEFVVKVVATPTDAFADAGASEY